jgi:hypothetical protein
MHGTSQENKSWNEAQNKLELVASLGRLSIEIETSIIYNRVVRNGQSSSHDDSGLSPPMRLGGVILRITDMH